MALYFCHKCRQQCNVDNRGGEVRCTRCNDSFVEELPAVQADTGTRSPNNVIPHLVDFPIEENPFGQFPTSPFSRLFQMFSQGGQQMNRPMQSTSNPQFGRTPSSRTRNPHLPSDGSSSRQNNQPPPNSRNQGTEDEDPMANFLQQIFTNLIAQQSGQPDGEAGGSPAPRIEFRFVAGPSQGNEGGLFGLHANLQDYAWGPNGLDNVLTALLNQFDQQQARAVRPEDIDNLPMTKVTQKQVENETQCTTCMETFKLGEEVATFQAKNGAKSGGEDSTNNCEHIFHLDCIKPWLQRNNTCPICRKQIDPSKWQKKERQVNDIDELD